MIKLTPKSYKPGVDRLEAMNKQALLAWLAAELRGQTHILAGKEEDYPVQAIVNHHPYLSYHIFKIIRLSDFGRSVCLFVQPGTSD